MAMGRNNVIPEKKRMASLKIAITIDDKILKQIDMVVKRHNKHKNEGSPYQS
jgi:hypothetical protein